MGADILRLGSGVGFTAYDGDATNDQRAMAVAGDIGRAAAVAGAVAGVMSELNSFLGKIAQWSNRPRFCPMPAPRLGRPYGPTIDRNTGHEVGRFVVGPGGDAMIEPVGGSTVPAGRGGMDTHTLYPNGSNYQRLNPFGHKTNSTPHGHGHLLGTGPSRGGQGYSLAPDGRVVHANSPDAHWPLN